MWGCSGVVWRSDMCWFLLGIVFFLMCPPLSLYQRYIEINITDNRHFALVYLLGITRLTFTWSTAQEPSIYMCIKGTLLVHIIFWWCHKLLEKMQSLLNKTHHIEERLPKWDDKPFHLKMDKLSTSENIHDQITKSPKGMI